MKNNGIKIIIKIKMYKNNMIKLISLNLIDLNVIYMDINKQIVH